jgi:hypothetical protein
MEIDDGEVAFDCIAEILEEMEKAVSQDVELRIPEETANPTLYGL